MGDGDRVGDRARRAHLGESLGEILEVRDAGPVRGEDVVPEGEAVEERSGRRVSGVRRSRGEEGDEKEER